ncbi:MAG: hypothetical protein IJU14_06950 [Clostridia bacterium]|nr:hypothetical protein [Clostridia bacterium]
MKKLFYCFTICIIIVSLFFSGSISALANNDDILEIAVNQQIQKGKSVTAQIRLKDAVEVSVLVMEIDLGKGLSCTDCHLSDGMGGKIITAFQENKVSITWIMTDGFTTNGEQNLIDLKIKANSTDIGNSNITVKLMDGTDKNFHLIAPQTKEYAVEIVEKVMVSDNGTQHTATANNTKTRKSSEISTSYQQKNSAIPTATPITELATITEIQLSTVSSENLSSEIKNNDGDLSIFLMGVLCCLGVVAIVIVSYTIGKRQAKK